MRDGVIQYAGIYCWRSTTGIDFTYGDVYEYSAEHELARKMALSTTVMGATVFGAFFLSSCVRFPPAVWLLISLTLVATCICEGMIFMMFNSLWCQNTDCGLATSSRCGISAVVFWFISSLMSCGIYKERKDKEADQDEG